MATIHISDAEAARDFAGLMDHVRAGVKVVIDDFSHVAFSRQAPALRMWLLSILPVPYCTCANTLSMFFTYFFALSASVVSGFARIAALKCSFAAARYPSEFC
jgi:hypothetical protein